MTWSKIDLDAALWVVPADRVKTGAAHEVPLSGMALYLLRSLPRFAGGTTAAPRHVRTRRKLTRLKDPDGREIVESLLLQGERLGRSPNLQTDENVFRRLRGRLGLAGGARSDRTRPKPRIARLDAPRTAARWWVC